MKHLYSVAILAGGLATRLHPLTVTIPKALLEIDGAPFIDHQLRLLYENGIRHVVLCVGYLGEMIQEHVGDGSRFGMSVEYSYDGPDLLGTGGAIRLAAPMLGEAFFVMYGDSYLDCDYAAIQAEFARSGKIGMMTVFHNEGQWDTSNIEFADKEIIAYHKTERTARMRHIDYGVGMLMQAAIQVIPLQEHYDLAALYQTLLARQQLAAFEVDKRFYEIGSFAGMKELEYHLAQEKFVTATTVHDKS